MLFEAFDLNSPKKWAYQCIYKRTFMFDITAQFKWYCAYGGFYFWSGSTQVNDGNFVLDADSNIIIENSGVDGMDFI